LWNSLGKANPSLKQEDEIDVEQVEELSEEV